MTITINEAALDQVLHSLTGPVQQSVFATAEEIRLHAAHKIPRSDGPGPHLADSSLVEDTHTAGIPAFLVAFESGHVGPYYFGARAHEIVPRNAKVLAFRWPKVGPGMFFFKKVNHPGNEPHPFLQDTVAEMFGAHLVG